MKLKLKTTFNTDNLSSFVNVNKPKTYVVNFSALQDCIIVYHTNDLNQSHKSRIINKYNLKDCEKNGIPIKFEKVDIIE